MNPTIRDGMKDSVKLIVIIQTSCHAPLPGSQWFVYLINECFFCLVLLTLLDRRHPKLNIQCYMYIRIDFFFCIRYLFIFALKTFYDKSLFGSSKGIIKHFILSQRIKPHFKESKTIHMTHP